MVSVFGPFANRRQLSALYRRKVIKLLGGKEESPRKDDTQTGRNSVGYRSLDSNLKKPPDDPKGFFLPSIAHTWTSLVLQRKVIGIALMEINHYREQIARLLGDKREAAVIDNQGIWN